MDFIVFDKGNMRKIVQNEINVFNNYSTIFYDAGLVTELSIQFQKLEENQKISLENKKKEESFLKCNLLRMNKTMERLMTNKNHFSTIAGGNSKNTQPNEKGIVFCINQIENEHLKSWLMTLGVKIAQKIDFSKSTLEEFKDGYIN